MTDETKQRIHDYCQRDSPAAVDLPKSPSGLLAWAAIRWGPAIIFAAVLVVGIRVIYLDFRQLSREMLETQRAQTEAGFETAQAIREISGEVAANRDAIQRLERQME